tara:strand:- start:263 stop:445 length:183 start_codon:yes stop_codon:yes gene_type:complete
MGSVKSPRIPPVPEIEHKREWPVFSKEEETRAANVYDMHFEARMKASSTILGVKRVCPSP